jgi:hypothetical protein
MTEAICLREQWSLGSIQGAVGSLRHCESIRVSLILRLTFMTEAICLREQSSVGSIQWAVFREQWSVYVIARAYE